MDETSSWKKFEGKDFDEFYSLYKSNPSERLLLHETLFGADTKLDFNTTENIRKDAYETHFSDAQNFEKNVCQVNTNRNYLSTFWGIKKSEHAYKESTDESFENKLYNAKGSHESVDTSPSNTYINEGNGLKNISAKTNVQNDTQSSASILQSDEDQISTETSGSSLFDTSFSVNTRSSMTSRDRTCPCQKVKPESQTPTDGIANPKQSDTNRREWNLHDVMEEFDRRYNYEDNEATNQLYCNQSSQCNMRMYNVLEEFATANEFVIEDSAPNGNCMFQAVRDQLAMKGDFRFTVLCLRQKAVDYLREHPVNRDGTHLQKFLPKGGCWNSYLSKMSMSGQWGDNLTLMALSESLGRHIIVVSVCCNGNICQHEFRPQGKDPETYLYSLHLGHLQESHYVSLRHASWKTTWSANAKVLRQAEIQVSKMMNPENHIQNTTVQEGLRSMPDFIDPVTGIPMPHLSFALKNLIEEYHPHPLIRPFPLAIREEYQDCFYSVSVGGKSDGTNVILEQRDISMNGKDFNPAEQCSTGLMVCKRYKVCERSLKNDIPEMIIAETDHTHPGYCRLRRGHFHEKIGCWHCSCDQCMTYLKGWKALEFDPDDPISVHLSHKVFPAYECPNWPTSANEWLIRKTSTEWPPPCLKEKIQNAGCHIMKKAHSLSSQPDVEWQYIFSEAEKILFASGLSAAQKFVYKVLKVLLDFHSQHLKVRLHTVHIKSTFFFACEEVEEAMFEVCPGNCLLFILGNMIDNLQNHNFPHYFIRDNNLIDHFSKVDVEQLKSAAETVRLFPFQSLTLMMSSNGYRRSWIVDILTQDFKQYSQDNDMKRVRSKLYFPITVILARKLASEKKLHQSYVKIREAELELILSVAEENDQSDVVPDFKHLLHAVVQSCEEETRSAFTHYIEDRIKCPIFDNDSKCRRVRDVMNEKDADEYANKVIPRDCVDNTQSEAKFLYDIGCELIYEKRNIRAASKFFAAAIDLLEAEIDETENLVVDDEELKRQISPQKYHSLSTIYQSLHMYYRNLYNAYTVLWETDEMHQRMRGLERVCRNLALQDLDDFVACIRNILGGTEQTNSVPSNM